MILKQSIPTKTIYLDAENGDDSNNGLTISTAVKTIQEALNRAPKGFYTQIRFKTNCQYIINNDIIIEDKNIFFMPITYGEYSDLKFDLNVSNNKLYIKKIYIGHNSNLYFHSLNFDTIKAIPENHITYDFYSKQFIHFQYSNSYIEFNKCKFNLYDNRIVRSSFTSHMNVKIIGSKIQFNFDKNNSYFLDFGYAGTGSISLNGLQLYDKNGNILYDYLNYIAGVKYDKNGNLVNITYNY